MSSNGLWFLFESHPCDADFKFSDPNHPRFMEFAMKEQIWRLNHARPSLVIHSVLLKKMIRKVSRSFADISVDPTPFRFL